MQPAIVERLNTLNRTFYDEHAEDFADTRPRLAPGIQRVLTNIAPSARVLELGCGDGKVARWLANHAAPAFYLGLDASEAMLARAVRFSGKEEATRTCWLPSSFALADLTLPAWTRALPPAPFDWILAFAVFHHLPGVETRARVLDEIAERLAPGGELVMSNWQFTRSERLRQRLAAWSEIGLTEAEVEAGDHLLTWDRKGRRGWRYVHLLDEAEARRLAAPAGLTVAEIFRADGGSGDLADYVRMRKTG